jgi:gamma-glutamyltranspeptidase/glutathione hydrolase
VTEAMRRAYRDRTFYLGDPGLREDPGQVLTSRDYAAGLRATIHPDKATPSDLLSGAPTPLEDEETTHFSIIDAEGNRVAVTQTVNLLYGSGWSRRHRRAAQQRDGRLRAEAGHAERIRRDGLRCQCAGKPGKRMLSSMTPTFMESPTRSRDRHAGRQPHHHHGAAGHPRLRRGLDAQQVAALPRYHHQWMPDALQGTGGGVALIAIRHALTASAVLTGRGRFRDCPRSPCHPAP